MTLVEPQHKKLHLKLRKKNSAFMWLHLWAVVAPPSLYAADQLWTCSEPTQKLWKRGCAQQVTRILNFFLFQWNHNEMTAGSESKQSRLTGIPTIPLIPTAPATPGSPWWKKHRFPRIPSQNECSALAYPTGIRSGKAEDYIWRHDVFFKAS